MSSIKCHIEIFMTILGVQDGAICVGSLNKLKRFLSQHILLTVYDTGSALCQRGVYESFYRDLFSHCRRNSTDHACPANMVRGPMRP